MKCSYKLVFILFGISAIFPRDSIRADGIKHSWTNYVVLLVSLLIIMIHVYETIYFTCTNINWALKTSDVTANVIFLMLRFKLSRKLHKLKRIASGFDFTEGKGRKMCFYSWVALSTLSHVLSFVSKVKY